MAFRPEEESDYTSSEEEVEDEEVLQERSRDEDYERLEIAIDNWPFPPCLGFMQEMSVVDIRYCIFSDTKLRLEHVLDSPSVHSWNLYHRYHPKQNIYCPRSLFQYEDWETIGEYTMYLSGKCGQEFSWYTVLRFLKYGKFVKIAPRPYLPKKN